MSCLAVASWTDFDAELADIAGCNSLYRRDGGLHFCATHRHFESREAVLEAANLASPRASLSFEMLDAAALHRLVPHLDRSLYGASYCSDDARINPHALRRALGLALSRLHVDYRPHNRVQWVREQGGEWVVMARGLAVGCGRVALACGIAGWELVPDNASPEPPLVAQPHSVVQTEPLLPFLPFASSQVNQAGDGSLLLDAVALEAPENADAEAVCERAASLCSAVRRVRMVRSWHRDRVHLPSGGACYRPLDCDHRCWFVASPDPLFALPVHSGLVADVVAGRVDANALSAFYGTTTQREASGPSDSGFNKAG